MRVVFEITLYFYLVKLTIYKKLEAYLCGKIQINIELCMEIIFLKNIFMPLLSKTSKPTLTKILQDFISNFSDDVSKKKSTI